MARTPTSLKLHLSGTIQFVPDVNPGGYAPEPTVLGRLEAPVSVTFRVGDKILEPEPEP